MLVHVMLIIFKHFKLLTQVTNFLILFFIGIEKSAKSSALDVEVVGKPQILHYKTQERQVIKMSTAAMIIF